MTTQLNAVTMCSFVVRRRTCGDNDAGRWGNALKMRTSFLTAVSLRKSESVLLNDELARWTYTMLESVKSAPPL